MQIDFIKKTITQNNNDIEFFSLKGSSLSAKNILFLGVMHGEEPQGKFLIEKFIKKINENNLKFKNNLYFIPCLNPDGMYCKKRGNSNNVDLNRNFRTKNYQITTFDDGTTSGNAPCSEKETQFLSGIIEEYNFDIILTLHAPFKIVNYDGDAQKTAEKISEITGYPLQSDIGYETPGSFGTFCGIERNIPTITLELPADQTNDELWIKNEKVFEFLANII